MFTKIFGKKKLKEDKLANIFVNSILQTVDECFTDIVGIIKESPEFQIRSRTISRRLLQKHEFSKPSFLKKIGRSNEVIHV